MTGFFIRLTVEGRARNVEVDRLPDHELEQWAAGLSERQARDWAKALARWIRECVRESPETVEAALDLAVAALDRDEPRRARAILGGLSRSLVGERSAQPPPAGDRPGERPINFPIG